MSIKLDQRLTLLPCAMLMISSIDSIRNLPATALFGSSLVGFLLLAAIIFLIPCALVSAELSALLPEKGGIYHWVSTAFGKNMGFWGIWLQWINTMIWYPTVLSFIAATIAYLIHPSLAENKYYLIAVILTVFWVLTWINARGLHTSANFAAVSSILGMLLPMIFIMGAGVIWIIAKKPSQISLTFHAFLPQFTQGSSWISLTAILASFLGVELTSVHVNNMPNAKRDFPLALLISVVVILITMLLGSLAIAIILPNNEIGLVEGVMQVFDKFLGVYHLNYLLPILTLMIVIGSLGSIINWLISPAKGLYHAGLDGFLPRYFTRTNTHGVPIAVLVGQGVVVSLICVVFLFMPSVNGSYWLLTDLSTQLYMLMYILMFISAMAIKKRNMSPVKGFLIPCGIFGTTVVSIIGITGVCLSLLIGFFPPEGINVGSMWQYELWFGTGLVLMNIPVLIFIYLARKRREEVKRGEIS